MKLLTHNMLTSHVKGVKNGYPLVINVSFSTILLDLKLILNLQFIY